MLEAGQNLILVTSKIYMKRFRFYSRYLVLRLILSVSTRFMFEPSDSEVKPIFRLPLEVRVTIPVTLVLGIMKIFLLITTKNMTNKVLILGWPLFIPLFIPLSSTSSWTSSADKECCVRTTTATLHRCTLLDGLHFLHIKRLYSKKIKQIQLCLIC